MKRGRPVVLLLVVWLVMAVMPLADATAASSNPLQDLLSTLTTSSGTSAPATTLPHSTPSTVTTDPLQYPTLWVHGYISTLGGCSYNPWSPPGVKADSQTVTLKSMLQSQGYTGSVLGVMYYCGDTGSFDIRNAAGKYDGVYGNDVPIERLGLDLAWAIWNAYSVNGQYVYLAGHSMGGLIIDEALTKTAEHASGYPPQPLLVKSVITYSTPYNGTDLSPNTITWCYGTYQCNEAAPGSAFITALQQRVLPSDVDWTTIGGGPADNVDSFASSSAVTAQHKVNYYSKTPVNYSHTSYYSDASTATDEPFQITNNGVTSSLVSWHATLLGAIALLSPDW